MKKLFILIASAIVFGILVGMTMSVMMTPSLVHAQNPTLSPYQYAVNNAPHTNCVVVTGQTNYCNASDGPYVSILGAPYVSMLGIVGATGPQGPVGATGAVGPQGVPGPAGAMPASFTCTNQTITSSGVQLSGCH
jgi:hypothetical protein